VFGTLQAEKINPKCQEGRKFINSQKAIFLVIFLVIFLATL
jgi:hypothetical protein